MKYIVFWSGPARDRAVILIPNSLLGRTMVNFCVMAISASLLFASSVMAQTVQGAASSTSLEVAKANRAKVRVSPSFIDGPTAELPESERRLGHHGKILIAGIIEIDGKMHDPAVKSGSGVAELDAIALDAAKASTFKPAMDALGSPLPVFIVMPFELVAYKSARGGIFEYRCEQFVRDMDWWRSTNPNSPYSNHELYKMELGILMLNNMREAHGDAEALRQSNTDFDNRWLAAIDKCRRKPTMLQKDALYR